MMPASPVDSAIFRDLLSDKDVAPLFTDSADVRAMMLVEGALAKVQGDLGMIPETAARAIHRASLELQIDPGGLAKGAGQSGVPVPALVEAFRSLMQAPEHAQFLHYGATSQDIMDTSLALRLRQSLAIIETRLKETVEALARQAETHADLPMAARTYGQAAVPTSFGGVVASWGMPLLRHQDRLASIRNDVEIVSLSGAAGTLSAMGKDGPEVRSGLAEALKLGDPGESRHASRDHIAALAGWLAMLTGSLGKMGADLMLMAQSDVAEITLAEAGVSSTMPQKANPVAPSLLVAIATQVAALNTGVQQASVHQQQRDGSAWFVEWLALPQMVQLSARALGIGLDLAKSMSPNERAMHDNLTRNGGVIFAEALTFALSKTMPRPEAAAVVKSHCADVISTGKPLETIAKKAHPDVDLSAIFDAREQLGTAPEEARAFVSKAQK